MKNKRWKREAKRMKGCCIESDKKHHGFCNVVSFKCPQHYNCKKKLPNVSTFELPNKINIRKLERLCKR